MSHSGFLVTGANGDIAEAICGILRETFPGTRVDGADAGGTRPGEALFDRMHHMPRADDETFLAGMRSLATDGGYGTVIPTAEAELWRLAHATPAELSGIPLLMAAAPLLRRFLDKLETARWLAAEGLNPPVTVPFEAARDLPLPIVIKPRQGRGSRGVEVVQTRAHLDFIRSQKPEGLIAQEHVGDEGQEYTCAVIRLGGQTRGLVLKRRLAGGRTVFAEEVAVPAIDDLIQRLTAACDLDGAINVQLRLTPEGPRVFEINPRFSSTVMMRHRLGFQDLLWAIRGAFAEFRPRPGRSVYRLSRELVFDA